MSNPTKSKSGKAATKPDAAEDLNEQTGKPVADSDPWAEALAEQAGNGNKKESPAPRNAGNDVFQPLDAGADGANARELEMIMDIPVKLSVELGRTRLTIKQLLELAQGSVVELDGLPGEPMDILINGYLIAQGEVVVVEDKFGIRITEIITPSERLQRLNR
ncbi:MAG TPA: flagellar motor switch protein FliN [Rhodanobacteraceae bacterium]|nr:flagellar motor switch protein FliN [Rhodanobacteraceae bacterium]